MATLVSSVYPITVMLIPLLKVMNLSIGGGDSNVTVRMCEDLISINYLMLLFFFKVVYNAGVDAFIIERIRSRF